MIVVPSAVFYQPKFTYIWSLGLGRFPDASSTRAREKPFARSPVLSRRGLTIPGELARVTGLSRPEAGRATGAQAEGVRRCRARTHWWPGARWRSRTVLRSWR
jgi:hypothetical protein